MLYENKPIFILEHDSLLIRPENLWYEKEYDAIFYDAGAMGGYIIKPKFALEMLMIIDKQIITLGSYATIQKYAKNSNLVLNSPKYHKKFKIASNQVY